MLDEYYLSGIDLRRGVEDELAFDHGINNRATADVKPVPHGSRKGWSAKHNCYPENPFIQDVDEPMWATTGGESLSLREIAGRITKFF